MKKLISLILAFTMLFSMAAATVPVAAATTSGEGFYLKPVPSASDADTLVFDLMINDVNGVDDITQYGLLLDYSDNLDLVSSTKLFTKEGMYVFSETIDVKPYLILWVDGIDSLPLGSELALVRFTFDVTSSLSNGIDLNLVYDPDNMPATVAGNDISEADLPVMGWDYYSYSALVKTFGDLADLPEAPSEPEIPVIEEAGFYLVPVSGNKKQLVFDLIYNDVNSCGATQYGLLLDYSDNISLSSVSSKYSKGTFMTSQYIDDKPYLILHVIGTTAFPMNVATVMVRLTFNIDEIGTGIYLDLTYEPNNKPATVAGKNISETDLPVMGKVYYSRTQLANMFPDIHNLTQYAAKAPTCTEIGWNAYSVCSECGYNTYEELPMIGHNISQYAAADATCDADGWYAYEACANCDYTTKVVIPATGHNLNYYSGKAATCTDDGWAAYEACTKCGYNTYRVIFSPGHSIVNHEKKLPTCTEVGWKAYEECTACEYTTYVEVPATGHNTIKYAGKEPTCVDSGWSEYEICMDCEYTTYTVLPATGEHTGGTATCTSKAVCDDCGQEYGGYNADNHINVTKYNGKAPTCTAPGWSEYEICGDCRHTTYTELPATGEHIGGTATCTSKAVCDDCGQEYGDVAADNHGETEIRDAVEATADADGYTGDTYCKDCGVKLADGEVIPKLSNPGDATGDGKINISDVSLILKSVAKWDVDVDNGVADVTGDGKVNISDVSLLLKYIAKWDVTLK